MVFKSFRKNLHWRPPSLSQHLYHASVPCGVKEDQHVGWHLTHDGHASSAFMLLVCPFDQFERGNNSGMGPAGHISQVMCPLKLEARAFQA